MADLTTRAIITAHDRLTGPLGAMAGRVQAINRTLAGSAREVGEAGRRASNAVTAGGVFGLGFALNAAKDFEKRMFGIGVATIPDAMARGEDAVKAAAGAIEGARKDALNLSSEMGLSIGAIGDIMESGAKGGLPVERVEDFTRAIGLLRLTDPDASAEVLAGWGVAMDALYKKAQKASGVGWGDWFKEQAGIAAVAAAQTQLSTGSFIEGMAQFQNAHAAMGVPSDASSALLASGVKAGQSAVIIGQTLKSNALRVLVPTLPNLRAWSAAGLDRSDYFTGETFINDPMKTSGAIMQLSGGAMSGKHRRAVQETLLQAQKDGTKASDLELQRKLTQQIATAMGLDLGIEENHQRIAEMLNTTLLTGQEVDMMRLYRDLAEKEVDASKIAQMFEGRRLPYNMAILSQIKNGFHDELMGAIAASGGGILGVTQDVYDESFYGRVERMYAAVLRLNQRMWTSPGITSFVEGVSTGIEKLDDLHPRIIEFGAYTALAKMLGVPVIGLAKSFGNLGKSVAIVGAQGAVAVTRFFGRLVGGSFGAIGKSLTYAATGFAALAVRGGKLGGLWGTLAKGAGVLGRFATPLGWITTGAWAAYEAWKNWDAIKGYLDGAIKSIGDLIGIKIEGSPLDSAFSWLGDKLNWIIEAALKAVEAISSVFFWRDASGAAGSGGGANTTSIAGDSEMLPIIEVEAGPMMDGSDAKSMGTLIGTATASAVRVALAGLSITVNGAGGAAAVAAGHVPSAPAPRTQNGGQHNGGN